jgi:hypothetical protein
VRNSSERIKALGAAAIAEQGAGYDRPNRFAFWVPSLPLGGVTAPALEGDKSQSERDSEHGFIGSHVSAAQMNGIWRSFLLQPASESKAFRNQEL